MRKRKKFSPEQLQTMAEYYVINQREKHIQKKHPYQKVFGYRVKKRDGFRCQMPNCKHVYKRRQLQVHHIRRWADSPELRYDLSNCITLCKYCHQSIWGKEEHYINLFVTIVNDKTK